MNTLILILALIVGLCYFGEKHCPAVLKHNKQLLLVILIGLVSASFMGVGIEGLDTDPADSNWRQKRTIYCYNDGEGWPSATAWGGGPGYCQFSDGTALPNGKLVTKLVTKDARVIANKDFIEVRSPPDTREEGGGPGSIYMQCQRDKYYPNEFLYSCHYSQNDEEYELEATLSSECPSLLPGTDGGKLTAVLDNGRPSKVDGATEIILNF